ncbi:MAG: heavy metal translocating P-type ATPase, partial [Phycisphaerales bacterium]
MTTISAKTHAVDEGGAGGEGLAGAWSALTSPRGELVAAIIAGTLLLAGWILSKTGAPVVGEALTWASLALGMFHGGRAALGALRAFKFDIDVLMVVGAGMAAALGKPAEGALLLFLFVLSGAMEALATARTTR